MNFQDAQELLAHIGCCYRTTALLADAREEEVQGIVAPAGNVSGRHAIFQGHVAAEEGIHPPHAHSIQGGTLV